MKTKVKENPKQIETQRRIDKKVNSILFPSTIDNQNVDNPFIVLKNINKIYNNDTQAVFDFNLLIKNKEFVVFVGPSGCGKSTTLRMICGLEEISSGELLIDNKYANELAPKDRDVAMVFQSYALYPHMTVRDNLAFSLKIKKNKQLVFDKENKPVMFIDNYRAKELRKRISELTTVIEETTEDLELLKKQASSLEPVIYEERENYYNHRLELASNELKRKNKDLEEVLSTPVQKYVFKHMNKKEIDKRVETVAELLEIKDYLARKPRALSGGQRQRVALGRAIVRDAKVFLMDEPLSNLDAKLRVQMRSELVSIHKKMGATTIYVTHDQTEAMTMANRIVIMKDGVVQQIGKPKDIYKHPANLFVATFIGSPAMNILSAKFDKNKITLANKETIALSSEQSKAVKEYYEKEIKRLESIIENLRIAKLEKNEKHNKIYGLAEEKARKLLDIAKENYKTEKFDVNFGIRPENISLTKDKGIKLTIEAVELLGSDFILHTKVGKEKLLVKVSDEYGTFEVGDTIYLDFNIKQAHLFDVDTSVSIIG